MPLLTASQLKLSYGDLDIFSSITLEVADRARIGIVGPNGGGKTSLLRVLVGEIEPNGGTVSRTRGLRIGYVPQTPQQDKYATLHDELMSAFDQLRRLEHDLATSALKIETTEARQRRQAEQRYSTLLKQYEALGGHDYESRVKRVASDVGLSAESLATQAHQASGGERTRAALARALLIEPDLLVLDEPTNYLDFKGLSRLETFLRKPPYAFIAVSHDRYFLDAVAGQIWELDHGRLDVYPGNYTSYRALKTERVARQTKEYERQQQTIAKEQSFIDRYHAGQRAREAKGREKRLSRLERIERPQPAERGMQVADRAVSRTPRVVVTAQYLRVGIHTEEKQVELLSVAKLTLERGSRTAVLGSNGTGKSTLLQTILGERPPLAGSVSLGDGIKVGYHRQGSDDLPNNATVLEAMQEIRNIPPGDERTYLGGFLFSDDDVFADVSALSGGERTRLAVARLMVTDPNFLVLDEPTTHLDIPSREALEEALQKYSGTLLVVSHDRHLISLLARQLLIVEDGAAHLFEGTFEEWAQHSGLFPAPAQRVKETPAKRRIGTPRKRAKSRPKPKAKSTPEPEPDYEQAIADLESRLARIEKALQSASEDRDVEKIARLGREYDSTQSRLDKALNAWVESRSAATPPC